MKNVYLEAFDCTERTDALATQVLAPFGEGRQGWRGRRVSKVGRQTGMMVVMVMEEPGHR